MPEPRPYSDATLDALADGPRWALADAITLHRALWQDDNRIPRLVTRQPPVTRDEHGELEMQGSQVGMPMSAALTRRIFDRKPGDAYPWVTALKVLRQECRRKHYAHRGADRPYWRGSLCWQAVYTVIVREFSVESASELLRIDRLEEVLTSAFAFMEQTMDDLAARAEQRAKHDVGVFAVGDVAPPEHHVVPGLHGAECPQCKRNAA